MVTDRESFIRDDGEIRMESGTSTCVDVHMTCNIRYHGQEDTVLVALNEDGLSSASF